MSKKGVARYAKARAKALSKEKSKIELACEDLLNLYGVTYKCQVPISRYIVDYLIEDMDVVIEVHGGYWHSREKAMKRDARKRKLLEERGYRVIELKQKDIHLWFMELMNLFGSYPPEEAR
jgi:very-short-patch-repair endonuclease